VDDLTAKLADPFQRHIHVRNRKVWERQPIAGPCPSGVQAKGRTSAVGLPAFTFIIEAVLELHVQDPVPEPSSSSRVVGGELHESDRRGHLTTIRLAGSSPDTGFRRPRSEVANWNGDLGPFRLGDGERVAGQRREGPVGGTPGDRELGYAVSRAPRAAR
jgi:hypothetical protein